MTDQSNPGMSTLGQAVKKGVAWTLTGRVVALFANVGASVLLARLLEPEDFGIFGIAMIFAGLTARFGNIGFGLALIQQKEIRADHVSSLFVVNLLIFSLIAGLLLWVSPLVGSFFKSAVSGRVLAVVALVFLAHPFSSVARVLMQRQMDFKGPAVANMVDHLASVFTSIVFALEGHGVWSLVYGHLTGSLLSTLVLMIRARWRPLLRYRHAAMKDLYSFGLSMFLKNLLIYGSDKIDYLIIGKQLGPALLGLYEKAFNIMDIAVKELSMKISAGVLFSAFSKIQNDQDRLRAAYTKVILTLSLVCFPFFFGLFLVAPSFIYVLFGEKWLPSVVPLQILCIAGLLRMHLQVTSTVINAMGRVAPEVWIRTIAFVLLALGCWIGSFWGIIAVTLAVTIVTGILTVIIVSYLGRLTGLSWADFIRPQHSAFLASLFMAGAVLIHQRWSEAALGIYSVPMLLSSSAVGIVSYTVALWILRPASVVSLFKELAADLRLAIHRASQ